MWGDKFGKERAIIVIATKTNGICLMLTVFVMCIASRASLPREMMSNALLRRERQNYAPIACECRMQCHSNLLRHFVDHCVFNLLANWRVDCYRSVMATFMYVVMHITIKL